MSAQKMEEKWRRGESGKDAEERKGGGKGKRQERKVIAEVEGIKKGVKCWNEGKLP